MAGDGPVRSRGVKRSLHRQLVGLLLAVGLFPLLTVVAVDSNQLLPALNRQVEFSLGEVAADVEKARQSEQVRRENIRQLATLRKQMHADLIGTLAWVRELVTMIHLAKFSGAPAARAEELVAQIAAAVQGLSEVSAWREHEAVAVAD